MGNYILSAFQLDQMVHDRSTTETSHWVYNEVVLMWTMIPPCLLCYQTRTIPSEKRKHEYKTWLLKGGGVQFNLKWYTYLTCQVQSWMTMTSALTNKCYHCLSIEATNWKLQFKSFLQQDVRENKTPCGCADVPWGMTQQTVYRWEEIENVFHVERIFTPYGQEKGHHKSIQSDHQHTLQVSAHPLRGLICAHLSIWHLRSSSVALIFHLRLPLLELQHQPVDSSLWQQSLFGHTATTWKIIKPGRIKHRSIQQGHHWIT